MECAGEECEEQQGEKEDAGDVVGGGGGCE